MKNIIVRKIDYETKTNKYGQVWYSGNVNADSRKPHGEGKRFYSNGDIFVGNWRDGRPEYGCLSFENDRRWIEGKL